MSLEHLVTDEVWKAVPDFENHYEVSTYGRIRSLKRERDKLRAEPLILKVEVRARYYYASLCKQGVKSAHRLHRLVLAAFVSPQPDGMEACHIDGDNLNNRLDNLRWGTKQENMADKARHNTLVRGEMQWNSKLTADQVREIRSLSGTLSHSQIGKRFGVYQQTITRIINRKSWSHV